MLEIFGKHTSYILSSYTITAVILSVMVVASLWKARGARKTLVSFQKKK
jgi:heme exporter protein CcmD